MKSLAKLKVALVCDWLTGVGGAERVVLELHHMFPDAPIYTSQYDRVALPWFNNADVRTLWLQKLPKSLRKFLPVLRAWAFSRLNLTDYDLIISSSGAEAKAVKKRLSAVHICYCHSPTHYYWIRYDEYMRSPGFGALDPLARLGLKLLAGPMKKWDKKAAQRPDIMIANSAFTQMNIKKYYGRDSVVVFPPVDTKRFAPDQSAERRHGFVTAGRQITYKRIDLAVQVCTKLNLPLVVIGNGPDHAKLQAMSGPTIKFETSPSDEAVAGYFKSAEGFIFPGLEDFGIVAVEAMAAGTPVIAYKGGGALDTVLPEKTGLFFDTQTVDSLVKGLQEFSIKKFNDKTVSSSARRFSIQNFKDSITKLIKRRLDS